MGEKHKSKNGPKNDSSPSCTLTYVTPKEAAKQGHNTQPEHNSTGATLSFPNGSAGLILFWKTQLVFTSSMLFNGNW